MRGLMKSDDCPRRMAHRSVVCAEQRSPLVQVRPMTNPYSPPASAPDTGSATFRCTPARRILTRIVAGRNREPRYDDQTQEYELYQAGLTRLVKLSCFFGPFLILALSLAIGLTEPRWLLVSLFIGIEGFACLMWLAAESVYFTDSYIRRFGPFRQRAKIHWSELQTMYVDSSGDLIFTDRHNNRVIVHNDLLGQHRLLEMLPQVVPRNMLAAQQQNLIELEKLVC